MDMYPDQLKRQIDELNGSLKSLDGSIKDFSKTSDNLQKKLIFWTKIMALAVILQAIVIVVQIFY